METPKGLGPQLLFRKLNPKEQAQIWQGLPLKNIEVIIKSFEDRIFFLSPLQVLSGQSAVFLADDPALYEYIKEKKEEPVFANFSTPKGQFFFSANTFCKPDSQLEVVRTSDLFILQRRESTRLLIPEGLSAQFRVSAVDGQEASFFCFIVDVSAGGIKTQFLEEPNVEIREGSICKGELVFQGHNPFPISAEVRFTMVMPGDGKRVAGMKFKEVNRVHGPRFMKFLMYLQQVLQSAK